MLVPSSLSSLHRIEAAVLRTAGGPLDIETLELEGPREDEILVRVVASGICQTDLRMCDSWEEADGPMVLGHEGAGVVEQVGPRVSHIEPGDHVVLSYQSCGSCRPCRRGRPTHCERYWELNFGFRRLDNSNALQGSGVRGHFCGQSSFATHLLATERNSVKVPKELPLELLAPLGCGLQAGAGTVINSLGVSAGAGIAVLGTGTVGLAAVMAARLVGADPIIAVDINPVRLDLARELGATHTIDGREHDVALRLKAVIGNGIEYTLEITGDRGLHHLAAEILKPRGTAAYLTGVSGPHGLSGGRRTLSVIQGDSIPQRFIPQLIAWYQAGRFPYDRLLTFYDFNEINRAITDARAGKTIKPVLRIGVV